MNAKHFLVSFATTALLAGALALPGTAAAHPARHDFDDGHHRPHWRGEHARHWRAEHPRHHRRAWAKRDGHGPHRDHRHAYREVRPRPASSYLILDLLGLLR